MLEHIYHGGFLLVIYWPTVVTRLYLIGNYVFNFYNQYVKKTKDYQL
jgi:hypothetical protein